MGRHRIEPKIRKRAEQPKSLPVVRQICWTCGTWAHSLPSEPKPVRCSMCGKKLEKPKWWDQQ